MNIYDCPRCTGISINAIDSHVCGLCRVEILAMQFHGIADPPEAWPWVGGVEFEEHLRAAS